MQLHAHSTVWFWSHVKKIKSHFNSLFYFIKIFLSCVLIFLLHFFWNHILFYSTSELDLVEISVSNTLIIISFACINLSATCQIYFFFSFKHIFNLCFYLFFIFLLKLDFIKFIEFFFTIKHLHYDLFLFQSHIEICMFFFGILQ